MTKFFATTAIAAAVAGTFAIAAPAAAAPAFDFAPPAAAAHTGAGESWQNGRHDRYRSYDRGRYGDRGYYNRRGYGEPVYRNTRTWRGNDGRQYCRRQNGTTGLIIGGAAGALLGREIDGGYNRTLGTVLGAAGGALLGREIDRGGSRCR